MQANNTNAAANAQQTEHDSNINDCQFDFYGLYLASVDSNGFIQVGSVNKDPNAEQTVDVNAYWKGHEGPIWQVTWAHPKYENVLATCGYDRKICVWKLQQGHWVKAHEVQTETAVNCISWAPWEYGLILAAGTAQGKIYTIENKADQWSDRIEIGQHAQSITGINWGPSTEPAILSESQMSDKKNQDGSLFTLPHKRIVTCSNDKHIKIWELQDNAPNAKEISVGMHSDQVRDVAWCNNIGLLYEMIATCSDDNMLAIWKKGMQKGDEWTCSQQIDLQVPLCKVSWSQVGNILAVSDANNATHLFNEQANGQWVEFQTQADEQ